MVRLLLSGFIAGIVAVLVFHQGAAFLLHNFGNRYAAVVGLFGRAPPPFDMAPVPPFGVPALLSEAVWGGVWGVVLAGLLAMRLMPAVLSGTLFGALVLTPVGVALVYWVHGWSGWSGAIPWRGLLYNGTWGFGVALLLVGRLSLRG